MYSTCLFCNQALGSNQLIEAFPVGRRLAFDQRRGRLWVVCRKCGKWNLTPLEERWEAIESCERLFRDTRKRASTDNIGLARLSEGLELVRIGEPQRPEFAAWRYGDQLGRRRKRGMIIGVGAGAVGLAIVGTIIGGTIVGGGVLVVVSQILNPAMQAAQWGGLAYRNRRTLAKLPSIDGRKGLVRGRHLPDLRLIPAATDQGWGIEVACEVNGVGERVTLDGSAARRLLAKLVPRLTPDGANRQEVLRAVRRIEEKEDPTNYLRWVARNAKTVQDWSWPARRDVVTGEKRKRGTTIDTLGVQGLATCLAVEMAVNEENERRALEGELALLELAWKDAEEIASIADRLALPQGVEANLRDLRRKSENH